MKGLKKTLAAITLLLMANLCFGQMGGVKKFDFSLLEDKVLYIPTWELNEKYSERLAKKGKLDKLANKTAQVEAYNKAWNEAMAESSYDATDYEIRGYNRKELFKKKDPKAIVLNFFGDGYGNAFASLVVTGPKKRVIANTIITGLDLTDKNDIRLMINMLNDSMNTAAEIQEEGGKKSIKNFRSKYKSDLVKWAEDLDAKTFLVPKSEHKNEKKAATRNADLKEALKSWKLSKYEFTTEDEVNTRRINGDEDSYYWKTFRLYTSSPLITFNYNYIISTDGDNIIAGFMGKKRLKPATLEIIQKKITAKVERYKKQLAK